MADFRSMVNSMLAPLKNRVYAMIRRAVLEAPNDGTKMQTFKMTGMAGESRDKIERFQNWGFTSVPPPGSECVAVAVGGNNDHMVVVACDDRNTRLKDLTVGDSAMYSLAGKFLKMKAAGDLESEVTAAKITTSLGAFLDMKVSGSIEGKAPTGYKFENATGQELLNELITGFTALGAEPLLAGASVYAQVAVNLALLKAP